MRLLLAFGLTAALSATASAHFNVILPEDYDQWSARMRSEVACHFVWGHGYEHIWFDAQPPAELKVYPPEASAVDLTGTLQEKTIIGAGGKKARAYRFAYRPEERGDHIIALKAAVLWDEAEGVFLQDYAKSVLHVQEKGGWERAIGHPLELVPLNRPYAQQEGGVIRVRVLHSGKPLQGCEVEFEKLQPRTPAEETLPGEAFITFEAVTDWQGIAAFGLHDTGWYALTAIRETGAKRKQDDHEGPLIERATLWIHIAPKTGVTP